MIELVPARAEHAVEIVKTLRAHDRFELSIACDDPVSAIQDAIEKAQSCWVAEVDGKVACMWGIEQESMMTGAHLWLITTSLIEKHRRKFLVESKRIVREVVAQYFFLYGFVDSDYKKSRQWLEWLGFVEKSTVYVGPLRVLRYELRAE